MAGFDDIIGQDGIVKHMKNAIKLSKISHAYILNGEKGMGKKTIAKAFATTILCEKKGDTPCMECHSCKQLMSDNHPDVKWIIHEKPATISVDDIREQINNDVVVKPYSSEYKIYIMDEAEKMNVQAQNALLKTIEEPPSYTIIMLLVSNKESFLQTILSRCVSLDVKPLDKKTIAQYLIKNCKMPDYQANMAADFSSGNLGRAIRLVTMETFTEMKEMLLLHMKSMFSANTADIGGYIKELNSFKDNISEYIDLLVAWFRDVLIFKASKDINQIIFKDQIGLIERYAKQLSYEGIENIFIAADKALTRLRANVNFELTMELMLMTIRDGLE